MALVVQGGQPGPAASNDQGFGAVRPGGDRLALVHRAARIETGHPAPDAVAEQGAQAASARANQGLLETTPWQPASSDATASTPAIKAGRITLATFTVVRRVIDQPPDIRRC